MAVDITEKEPYRAVFHEMGHFVVAAALEIDTEYVEIALTETGVKGCAMQVDGTGHLHMEQCVIVQAGQIAEGLFLPASDPEQNTIRWSGDKGELNARLTDILSGISTLATRRQYLDYVKDFFREQGFEVELLSDVTILEADEFEFVGTSLYKGLREVICRNTTLLCKDILECAGVAMLDHLAQFFLSHEPDDSKWHLNGRELFECGQKFSRATRTSA